MRAEPAALSGEERSRSLVRNVVHGGGKCAEEEMHFELFLREYELETTDLGFAICGSSGYFGVGGCPARFEFCDMFVPGF